MNWEYCMIERKTELDAYGQKGWECYAVIRITDENGHERFQYHMKRSRLRGGIRG